MQRIQTVNPVNPFGPPSNVNPALMPSAQPSNPFFPQSSPQFGNPFGNTGAYNGSGAINPGFNQPGNPFQPQFGAQLQPTALNPFVAQPVATNPFTPTPVNTAPINPFLAPNSPTTNPNYGQPFTPNNNLF